MSEYKCRFMEECPVIMSKRGDCDNWEDCAVYRELEILEQEEETQIKDIEKYVSD